MVQVHPDSTFSGPRHPSIHPSVQGIQMTTRKKLCNIKGISEAKMEKIKEVAAKLCGIVDSIMALFRVDFSGRGELADRQQKLAQLLSRLQKIAEVWNAPSVPLPPIPPPPSFQADPKKPIGGHILAHASTTRVMLRKGRAENRIAKVYDSPDLPENEATFAISAGGVIDAKE
ncbi:meiotic recombination protein DMC1/LIM15 homolog [Aplysia californica]|uniref:Meiotic recombination protein DMC1/LIM15 homolog n=1 Tax=Aplysia californica TaxID=6500 RepID=A0ABM0JIM2_APLCA|nr:meiotic recombination protein DMC1/LIM15 homolog [Aplysia californica]